MEQTDSEKYLLLFFFFVLTLLIYTCLVTRLLLDYSCYLITHLEAHHSLADSLAERLRRWFQVPVRKGVGSSPTAVTIIFSSPTRA